MQQAQVFPPKICSRVRSSQQVSSRLPHSKLLFNKLLNVLDQALPSRVVWIQFQHLLKISKAALVILGK